MNKCINCGSERVKTIQAGVSKKTGKPYSSFSKCEDCQKTWNPPIQTQPSTNPSNFEYEMLQYMRNISANLAAIRERIDMKADRTNPEEMGF